MSARLTELQRQLGQSRRRLEELARRVAVLRERAGAPGEASAGEAAPRAAAPVVPLFQGLGMGDGALDDVELTFEVLDTEDPGREGR
jgi:hypothetical protein